MSICLQVLLFGESQGGHVAAKMAARIRPDLLIFISSLPEPVDAEAIRRDDITTVVGWKVVRSYARASYIRKVACVRQAEEKYFGKRDAALKAVESMGPRAFLARDRRGRHGSWNGYEVGRITQEAWAWVEANPRE